MIKLDGVWRGMSIATSAATYQSARYAMAMWRKLNRAGLLANCRNWQRPLRVRDFREGVQAFKDKRQPKFGTQ